MGGDSMKLELKREIIPFLVLIIFITASIYFYKTLPDIIPSHFDINGKPDAYMPKTQLMLIFFAVLLGLYILLTFIPLIDPFWKKIQSKYSIFLLLRDFVLLFFLYFYIIALIAGKEGHLSIVNIGIGFGFLFILLGNYLPKLPRNFFFGIRTPWTLASETVWRKTHILGGWLFVLSGILIIILSYFKVNLGISLLITLLPLLIISSFLYPFLLYKKLQREENKLPQL
jgi:uncharacterized membrane protein